MLRRDFSSQICYSGCIFMLVGLSSISLLLGCSDSGRLPIKGVVNFAGSPVENGYVHFTPTAGTKGPTAGADIVNGLYEVDASKGLFKGDYLVSVKAFKEAGKYEDPVTGEISEGMRQIVPLKYNEKTELTVKLTGENKSYKFNLEP